MNRARTAAQEGVQEGGKSTTKVFTLVTCLWTTADLRSDNTDSTESEEENPEPPDCKDTVCPRIVSMTVHDSALYVVARTIDDTIAYRRLTDDSWDDWEDLGDPRGRLISQPSTFAWNVANVIPRLDLVAVSTDDRTVYSRWHSEFEGWASPDGVEWRGLGPDAGSPIAMCSPFTDRLDLWGTDRETRNITKTEWYQKPDDEINEDGEDGDTNQNGWFYSAGNSWTWQPLKPSRSAPAVICRESSTYHDILFYANEDNALYHAAWSNEDEWQTSEPWQGDWIGDPTLYNSEDDPERWHFFGLQENDELYYLSWSSSSGQSGTYTDLISLGGSIISTPAVISLERGGLDIVALNTNGTLQHRHYDGSEWSADWEDLGVRAHSAPTIALLEDKVYIAAVAQSGSLRVWSRGDSVEEKWKNSLKTANLGGDLSLDFFTQDL